MSIRKKTSTVFLFFSMLSCLCWGESIYLTFPKKDSAEKLSKADMTLRINTKEIALTEFIEIDSTNRSVEMLSHPAGRRQYFIVVDLLYMNASQVLEVRKLVQQFVAQVPRDDLVALAAITHEDGLRFYSALTADRSKLTAGWNAMGKVVVSGMTEGPEGNLYPSKFSPDMQPIQLLPDQEFAANLKTYALSDKSKEEFAPLYVQSFVDVVSLFSTVPGRKHLILFSPGTEVKGLRVNLQEMSEPEKDEKDEKDADSSDDVIVEHKTLREIQMQAPPTPQAMASQGPQPKRTRENDANIVPKLMEGTGGQIHVFRPGDQEKGFLKDLSQKSKGVYKKTSEFSAAIGQILNHDKVFYVVGWNGELQKDFHELQPMELRAKNAAVDAPLRLLAPKPWSDYTVLEKRFHLSQAVYKNFKPSDSYRFWSDIIFDEGFNRISSFTQVQGKTLLQYKAPKLDFVFYGFALEEDGTLIDFSSTPISLDLTNQNLISRLEKAGLKIWNVLFAAHKPVTVRTIVWNNLTGEAVTHSARMEFDQSRIFLTNPFFPSSNFDWIFWPAPDQTQNRRGKEVLYPYQIGADIFTPELFPRLQPAEKGKVVYFKMYNVGAGNKYPPIRLRFVGENGSSTEIEKFGLMQQPRLIQGGGLELFWTIESIPSLAKGTYRLQVDVTDPVQGKAVTREVITAIE